MTLINKRIGNQAYLCFVVAVTHALLGCGGEGGAGSSANSGSNNQNQTVTLSAQDATYSTGYTELFEVDLTSKVFSSNGSGFTLNDVEVLSDNNNCQIESKTESTFAIKAIDTKVCNYRYHVIPKAPTKESYNAQTSFETISGSIESSSSAVTRVAVSSNPNTTELIPLSDTTLVNESVSIDLKVKLEDIGYDLGSEFVLTELTLPYNHSSSAEINTSNNQLIDYTPEQGFTGIDRILYTFEDSTNGLVLMGIVDIAIGYEANQGFTITENIEYPDTVDVSTSIDIDISEFVSSDDGDDFQLVYVESFNAEATSKDPLDITNKIITFQASTPGYHYISFAVSDHNGLYDMGLIRVEVVDPNQAAKWGNIFDQFDLYTAPLTALDAVSQGAVYDAKLVDTNYTPNIDMAGFRFQSANTYCSSIGAALPSAQQLQQMRRRVVPQDYNWPVTAKYLGYFEANGEPTWVDLDDGTVGNEIDPAAYYYVTCVKQGLMTFPNSDTQAVANGVDTAIVSVELKLDDEVVPNQLVTVSRSGMDAVLDFDTATTDSDGVATFTLTSTKAELVTLTAEVYGISETYNVTFIADETTATVTSAVTIDNSSVQGHQITSTLLDFYKNPVEGRSVAMAVNSLPHPDDASVTVTPLIASETENTDVFGNQKTRVAWDSNVALPTQNMTFDVTSSYTTSTTTSSEAVSQVTFIAYLCGGEINDASQENGGDACIKVAQSGDYQFTGTPSINFLDSIDYHKYNGMHEEHGSSGPNDKFFAGFTREEAVLLCEYYNTLKLNGNEDWRLAPSGGQYSALFGLTELFNDYGHMWVSKGWPTTTYITSTTAYNGNSKIQTNLGTGKSYVTNVVAGTWYVSCISGP
ncbi:Ig-like domain-containing protein [Vibrio chagasii]|uniref:Ig-like domain-containing protein n=1 Tax=Vibrio chagasii TaxID=170679 RepID=UPI0040685393